MTRKQKRDMYLDWVNNFLTVDRLAEYYGLTVAQGNDIINQGRTIHEEEVIAANT